MLRPLLIFVMALCGTGAYCEDAGENVRTSAKFGRKIASIGPYEKICQTIEGAAKENSLPIVFFARVIWQESKFDVTARSSAGALGIAQFMPKTASSRGLLNPFDPVEALYESAGYLRELKNTFGNLGLAAAAYNAGPGRLSRWLSGKVQLPGETIAYVRLVTGHSAAEWASAQPPREDGEISNSVLPCTIPSDVLANEPEGQNEAIPKISPWAPWGVHLAGHWTKGRVLASYERLRRNYVNVLGDKEPLIVITYGPSGLTKRYLVRVAEDTRIAAEQLCARLQAAGGSCFVVRNHTEQEQLNLERLARDRSQLPGVNEARARIISGRGKTPTLSTHRISGRKWRGQISQVRDRRRNL